MEGSALAIMDLPLPGGPIMIRLWPPDAATSRARFTVLWPFTSAKSALYPFDCMVLNNVGFSRGTI